MYRQRLLEDRWAPDDQVEGQHDPQDAERQQQPQRQQIPGVSGALFGAPHDLTCRHDVETAIHNELKIDERGETGLDDAEAGNADASCEVDRHHEAEGTCDRLAGQKGGEVCGEPPEPRTLTHARDLRGSRGTCLCHKDIRSIVFVRRSARDCAAAMPRPL